MRKLKVAKQLASRASTRTLVIERGKMHAAELGLRELVGELRERRECPGSVLLEDYAELRALCGEFLSLTNNTPIPAVGHCAEDPLQLKLADNPIRVAKLDRDAS